MRLYTLADAAGFYGLLASVFYWASLHYGFAVGVAVFWPVSIALLVFFIGWSVRDIARLLRTKERGGE